MKIFHVTAHRNGLPVRGWNYVPVKAKTARKAAAYAFGGLREPAILQVMHNSRDRTDTTVSYFAWDFDARTVGPATPHDFSDR